MREDIEPFHLVLTLTAGVITVLFKKKINQFDILRKFNVNHILKRSDFFVSVMLPEVVNLR